MTALCLPLLGFVLRRLSRIALDSLKWVRIGAGRLEGGCGLRSDAMGAALRRLMASFDGRSRHARPAQDERKGDALAVKLDLAAAHELATLDGGEACLAAYAAIRRDARRMALRHPSG